MSGNLRNSYIRKIARGAKDWEGGSDASEKTDIEHTGFVPEQPVPDQLSNSQPVAGVAVRLSWVSGIRMQIRVIVQLRRDPA